jgi:hypothetical protein
MDAVAFEGLPIVKCTLDGYGAGDPGPTTVNDQT